MRIFTTTCLALALPGAAFAHDLGHAHVHAEGSTAGLVAILTLAAAGLAMAWKALR